MWQDNGQTRRNGNEKRRFRGRDGRIVSGAAVAKPGQRSRVRERPAFTFSPVTERLKVAPNYPAPSPGVFLSDTRTRLRGEASSSRQE